MDLFVSSTRDLDARARVALDTLVGPATFDHYSHVAHARDAAGVAGVRFFERRTVVAAPTLIFLGPTFLRDDACERLLVGLIRRWARESRGFVAMAEVEGAEPLRRLRELIGPWLLPPDERAVSYVQRIRAFVPDVHDFDPATFTSARASVEGSGVFAARRRVVVFGCAPHQRARLVSQLARQAVASLRVV